MLVACDAQMFELLSGMSPYRRKPTIDSKVQRLVLLSAGMQGCLQLLFRAPQPRTVLSDAAINPHSGFLHLCQTRCECIPHLRHAHAVCASEFCGYPLEQ